MYAMLQVEDEMLTFNGKTTQGNFFIAFSHLYYRVSRETNYYKRNTSNERRTMKGDNAATLILIQFTRIDRNLWSVPKRFLRGTFHNALRSSSRKW